MKNYHKFDPILDKCTICGVLKKKEPYVGNGYNAMLKNKFRFMIRNLIFNQYCVNYFFSGFKVHFYYQLHVLLINSYLLVMSLLQQGKKASCRLSYLYIKFRFILNSPKRPSLFNLSTIVCHFKFL